MRGYLRTTSERDAVPMTTLVFRGEDLGHTESPEKYDCLISKMDVKYVFDWGLDGHERVGPKMRMIREGRVNETGYSEIELPGGKAIDAIVSGEAYRTKLQGNSNPVTIHRLQLSDPQGMPEFTDFQEKAAELYKTLEVD